MLYRVSTMAVRLLDIESGQQPLHLFAGDRPGLFLGGRPLEPIGFEPFVPERIPVFIEIQHLQGILLPTAENEVVTAHRVHLQRVGYQAGQTVNRLAHVRSSQHQPDPSVPLKPKHRSARTPGLSAADLPWSYVRAP